MTTEPLPKFTLLADTSNTILVQVHVISYDIYNKLIAVYYYIK